MRLATSAPLKSAEMSAHTSLDPDLQSASKSATLGVLRLHYLDSGAGPPVVMVHGNPNWVYYWRNLIPALADCFRCLAIDHIGCGLSDKPGEDRYPFTLARRIDDLAAWLEQLGVRENVHLVAHDWGGMIACGYATRFPERVAKLVMLNTAAFPLPATARIPWQLRLARTPLLGAILLRGFNAFSRGAVQSCVTRRPMPPEVARAYCAPYDSWAHRLAVHRFVQDIPLKPGDRSWETVAQVARDLPKLAAKPLLLGWGERDFVFNDHFLQEWLKRFPTAELQRYPDCGHYVLEDAAEDLIPAIREFLLRPT
jgi:cis-3-alkyl-4-acyloxetan-2-one decarboxylase